MTTTKRILFALALLGGAAAWAGLLTAIARQSGHAPAAPISMPISLPELDELGARMIHAAEITRRWEYLAERHRQVSQVACEQLADAATRREVR